jgi:hypothetical protein
MGMAAAGTVALFGRPAPAMAEGVDRGADTGIGMGEGRLHRAAGAVSVNGRPARTGAMIAPGDTVAAGPGAEAVFTLGDDGFLLRAEGAVTVADRRGVREMTLERGRVLSVFGPKAIALRTPQLQVGIRGTAAYLEALPDETRVCVCYGHADMVPLADPARAEEVRTRHHDAPRRVRDGIMTPYRQADHTDQELVMLEALLGRVPPFLAK